MIGLSTIASCRRPPLLPGRSARQRERDAEEAGWEARLRQLPKHATRHVDPVPVSAPAPLRTVLDLVTGVDRHDMLLIPRTLPIAVGGDGEDLACGQCACVIASGTSRASARGRYPEGDRLVVRCTCRALNLLSGQAGPRSSFRQALPVRARPGTR